jgi:hypothetical protein
MTAQRGPIARLVRFLQSFGPRASKELVARLLGQLGAGTSAVATITAMLKGEVAPEEAIAQLVDIEHEGDRQRAEFVDLLARTLVTPLDREDLYRCSRALDDLVDELRDFAREWRLIGGLDGVRLLRVLDKLRGALGEATTVIAELGKAEELADGMLVGALRAANQVRMVHEDEITSLLQGEVTMEVLRSRELLHRLDAVGLHLVAALTILADSMVKRGE